MQQDISFVLDTDNIALCDLLKITSVANSGGQAKMMITSGLVSRNNIIETRKTAKIKAGDIIKLKGITINVH